MIYFLLLLSKTIIISGIFLVILNIVSRYLVTLDATSSISQIFAAQLKDGTNKKELNFQGLSNDDDKIGSIYLKLAEELVKTVGIIDTEKLLKRLSGKTITSYKFIKDQAPVYGEYQESSDDYHELFPPDKPEFSLPITQAEVFYLFQKATPDFLPLLTKIIKIVLMQGGYGGKFLGFRQAVDELFNEKKLFITKPSFSLRIMIVDKYIKEHSGLGDSLYLLNIIGKLYKFFDAPIAYDSLLYRSD